jgi:hypothetical protein
MPPKSFKKMRWSKTVVVTLCITTTVFDQRIFLKLFGAVFDQRIFLKLFGGIRSTID